MPYLHINGGIDLKKLIVLGSTGSIGTQTLEVAENLQSEVVALTANSNLNLLEKQIRKFHPAMAVLINKQAAQQLKQRVADTDTRIYSGIEGIISILQNIDYDIVINGISGMAGTLPTIEAVKAGHDIALANKESIVTAGEYILHLANKKQVKILSVDSEHSAIQQCIDGCHHTIKRILLTASGGPFFGMSAQELRTVTKAQALQHPNWAMGTKITLDSATLMNKGLEWIEAVRLFNVSPEQIKIIIHRQSVVHSAVEFEDNAIIAQMGTADMRVPIQYAITYPQRVKSPGESLDLIKLGTLTFSEPDTDTFQALSLAESALHAGGTAPTILNAANEVAVQKFLEDKLTFAGITEYVKDILNKTPVINNPSIEQIFETDERIRRDYGRK